SCATVVKAIQSLYTRYNWGLPGITMTTLAVFLCATLPSCERRSVAASTNTPHVAETAAKSIEAQYPTTDAALHDTSNQVGSPDGHRIRVVARGQDSPRPIAVDNSDVVWGTQSQIVRASIAGGSLAVLATEQHRPFGIALSAGVI